MCWHTDKSCNWSQVRQICSVTAGCYSPSMRGDVTEQRWRACDQLRYAEQNKLFCQGRYHNPGPIITHARGGRSVHNFGIAWDIGIFTEARGYIPDGPLYDEAAKAGLTDTLAWGGNWTSVDKAHYQLKLDEPIQVVRQHFESGQSFSRNVVQRIS